MSSSRRSIRAAAFFGLLAVAANPVAVGAAQFLNGVPLLRSLYVSVPAAALLALIGFAFARRARLARARSVHADAVGSLRLGRFLAWAGLYAAFTGAVALGVYGALRAAG